MRFPLSALVSRLLDANHNGKLELSDLPALLNDLASLKAQGDALVGASISTVAALRAMAHLGELTQNGTPISAEDVEAAWNRAKVPFATASTEAQARLHQD